MRFVYLAVTDIHLNSLVIEIGDKERHTSDIYAVYCVTAEGTVLDETISQAPSKYGSLSTSDCRFKTVMMLIYSEIFIGNDKCLTSMTEIHW